MDAKKCDKCGINYEKYASVCLGIDVNTVKLCNGDEENYSVDLCPACMFELMGHWLNFEYFNGHRLEEPKKPVVLE